MKILHIVERILMAIAENFNFFDHLLDIVHDTFSIDKII